MEDKKNENLELKKSIRTIPHFPKQGIMFRDITTLLQDPKAFKKTCDALYQRYKDQKIDVVVGIKEEYELEYGKNTIEIHEDAIKKGQRVLIVDDLIATAGTAKAAINLVEKLGGKVVECCFVVELPELKGREKLKGYSVFNLVEFEGE